MSEIHIKNGPQISVGANGTATCKCCGNKASFAGHIDFNKSCVDAAAPKPFPHSGEAVPYWVCTLCGFIFTTYMDGWTNEQFRARIYNDEYIKADPPIIGRLHVPPRETPSFHRGKYIASFFPDTRKEIRVLDFGSGANQSPVGLALTEEGFDVTSYDPYRAETRLPDGKFELIVAIEVFEHVADLRKLGEFMVKHLSRDGLIWIQTVLHAFPPIPPNVLDSWYIAPRNGHISIFTLHSLTMFLRGFGINVVQTAAGLIGFRNLPLFPNRIFLRA